MEGRLIEILENVLKKDMGMVHDVLWESLDLDLSEVQILALSKHFPKHIVFKALEYGFYDTEVRDLLYVWSEDRKDEIVERIL